MKERWVMKKVLSLTALIIFCAIGLVSETHGLDLSDLRTQIRQMVKDTSSTRQRYSDTVLNGFINEIHRDFNNRTWSVTKSTHYVLNQGTTYYSLPNDLIAIQFVTFQDQSGNITNLTENMERTLRQSNPDFETEGGEPTDYFVRTSTRGADPLEVGYFPIPSGATSTGTARIDYFSQVTDMSSDTDEPFEGYEVLFPYHDAIIYGVSAKIELLEGDFNRGNAFLTLYNSLIGISADRTGRAPNYVPSFSAGPNR